ncbi:hypothetical protein ES703_45577 [subsurface metagenome]
MIFVIKKVPPYAAAAGEDNQTVAAGACFFHTFRSALRFCTFPPLLQDMKRDVTTKQLSFPIGS